VLVHPGLNEFDEVYWSPVLVSHRKRLVAKGGNLECVVLHKSELVLLLGIRKSVVELSRTRGNSATLVPHASGVAVRAHVLVLSGTVSLVEAKNLLWRRETRTERSGRTYQESSLPNAVLVGDTPNFCGLDHVLHTDFNLAGKLSAPDPKELAKLALKSVTKAPNGSDGISYLIHVINAGVETRLTARYQEEILALTGTSSLAEALATLRRERTEAG
jgi:hypothetical protein